MGREKPVNIMYICEHNGHWSAQRRDVFVFKWKWFSSIFFYCIVFLRDECPNFSYLRNVIISNKNFITRTNQLSFTFQLFENWLNFFFRLIRKSNDILISCKKKTLLWAEFISFSIFLIGFMNNPCKRVIFIHSRAMIIVLYLNEKYR